MRNSTTRPAVALAAVLTFLSAHGQALVNPGPLPKVAVPSVYFENSVVCRNLANGVVCQLWLNRDGTYQVAFNRGPQELKPSVDGPWQMEGRDGTYSMRVREGVTQVCLQPHSGAGSYEVERQNELFASAGCYPLATRAIGDTWEQRDGAGHTYNMWLVEGR